MSRFNRRTDGWRDGPRGTLLPPIQRYTAPAINPQPSAPSVSLGVRDLQGQAVGRSPSPATQSGHHPDAGGLSHDDDIAWESRAIQDGHP